MDNQGISIKAFQIHVYIFIIMILSMRIIIHQSFIISQHNQACISNLKPMMIKAYYKICEDLKDLIIENPHTFQVLTYR